MEWTGGRDLGVATKFRFRNQIGHFGPLTYIGIIHQILGLELAWEGVRHPRLSGLWADLHYGLIDNI